MFYRKGGDLSVDEIECSDNDQNDEDDEEQFKSAQHTAPEGEVRPNWKQSAKQSASKEVCGEVSRAAEGTKEGN
jgi:hypothetical protein